MKQKSKIKRAVITSIAAICALSSAAAISGSAVTYTYTVSVAAGSNSVVHGIPSTSGSTHVDVFSSYPTIYDNKSSSTVQSWVSNLSHTTNSKKITNVLQKDSPAVLTANYNIWNYTGETYHNFLVTSGGGFRDSVTTTVK